MMRLPVYNVFNTGACGHDSAACVHDAGACAHTKDACTNIMLLPVFVANPPQYSYLHVFSCVFLKSILS